MEQKRENEMATWILKGFIGSLALRKSGIDMGGGRSPWVFKRCLPYIFPKEQDPLHKDHPGGPSL